MRHLLASLVLLVSALLAPAPAAIAQEDQASSEEWTEVGETGFGTNRLVLASACPHACPWGELGDFVKEAMEPAGYEIILCRNCNRAETSRIVSGALYPPPLVAGDFRTGTTERVRAPIDFGITAVGFMNWAYNGQHLYSEDGPYPNLRLISRIEDPSYLMVAVKPELGITSLAEIRERRLPVTIVTNGEPNVMPVLEYYGLDQESLESWGGSMTGAFGFTADTPFDVMISSNAGSANNPESRYWTTATVLNDLQFLDLPEELLDQLVETTGMMRVTARWGLLRGVDREIETVGRTGHVVFTRDDMPDQVAYDIAKAIDQARGGLIWYTRVYSLNPDTVAEGGDVPLHPGAERYYREMGYID